MKNLLLALILGCFGFLPAQAQQLIYNPTFQGSVKSNIDLGGHQILNGTIAWPLLTGVPTTLSGYGINDPLIVTTTQSYANPAWLTSLAWTKLSGVPTTAAGYGIVNGSLLDAWGLKAVPSGAVVGTTDTQALTGKTLNGLTVSTTTGTLAVGAGKTFTAANTLTLAGTDESTLSIGTGGTLGSAAYTASTVYPLKANNLSDLANAATARTNLGLATVAASGSASDLGSGTLSATRLPAFTGDIATSIGTSSAVIQANAVTNTKLAPMASMTIKANVTGATASPTDAALPTMGYKNILIGGDFSTNPWQRGTNFTGIGGTPTYTADRWSGWGTDTGSNMSVSKVTGIGLAGFTAALRVQRPGGTTTSGLVYYLSQCIASSQVAPLQGKACTLSFWARAGANFSSSNLQVRVRTGTTADEGLIPGLVFGWTGIAEVSSNFAPTTGWVRYSFPVTYPSNALESVVMISMIPSGTAGTNDYFDIAGVQLEANPYATAFEARPAEMELALCQAYYEIGGGGSAYENYCLGQCTATTSAKGFIPFKVPKRMVPTIALTGAPSLWAVDNASGTQVAGTAVSSNFPTLRGFELDLTTASGLVGGNAANIRANNSTAQGWSANSEL